MECFNLDKIKSEMDAFDEKREEFIAKSRSILRNAKKAIYDIHRNNLDEASVSLEKLERQINLINDAVRKDSGLLKVGSISVACQEYAEALCFLHFVKTGNILEKPSEISSEDYLLGLCDLTGELARRAVFMATEMKSEEVRKIRNIIDTILKEFLKFDFRNSELRKKSDSIKWNLNKVEEILYELKLRLS